MKRAGKIKKSAGQTRRPVMSAGLRAVTRMQTALQNDREKLAKRLEKSIRQSTMESARLSAQLDRLQKTKSSGKPVRGRKPAKNALQTLQAALKVVQTELGVLTLAHQKLIAEKKALAAFEKEWKKTGAKSVKAAVAKSVKSPKRQTAKKSGRKKAAVSPEMQPAYEDVDYTDIPQPEMA